MTSLDLANANPTEGVLSGAGYRVITLGCGRDVLTALAGCRVNLVIDDWGLPDMNGAELVSNIRTAYPAALPILMITGWSTTDTGPMDVNAWLRKPFDRDQVLGVVQDLLGSAA